jgi:NRAMP (natural resistance-associated macrophage protein)-like metal ion transporter
MSHPAPPPKVPAPSVPRSLKTHAPRPVGRWSVKRALAILGPGLVTGASDDDPSGIATYAAAGAAFGYLPLWTALVTFPMMAAVQFICAKIGLVTGRGLAGVLRRYYPRPMLYGIVFGLVVANTINVGTDLGAIAAAIGLLIPTPPAITIVAVAATILAFQIWGTYRLIASIFKWLTLALFAYVGAAFLARPEARAVLYGTFVPTLRWDSHFLAMIVAILGTTISPYLFFWQASQEVEEEIARGRRRLPERRGATDSEIEDAAWDVNIGMLLSNVVMYFIILATGATLFPTGTREVETATQAAEALRPLAGDGATVLLALGLIGSGVLAVPILSGSAAYAVSEMFGWRFGLDLRWRQARQFYAIIAISTVVGIAINFLGIAPMRALFFTAVVNGFVAPPLLLTIMLVANDRRVMSARTNGPLVNVLGWATTLAMFAAAIALVVAWNA